MAGRVLPPQDAHMRRLRISVHARRDPLSPVLVVIAEEIVAGVTVTVLGCLWLSARVVEAVYAPDPLPLPIPEPEPSEPPEPVWPFQSVNDPCAICGATVALSRAERHFFLEITCAHCGACYLTEPSQPPNPDSEDGAAG
jgi:hypothetical protein